MLYEDSVSVDERYDRMPGDPVLDCVSNWLFCVDTGNIQHALRRVNDCFKECSHNFAIKCEDLEKSPLKNGTDKSVALFLTYCVCEHSCML